MLMCMHTFLAEGRACLRTHAPGQQCEWILSCRSACQSYRALGQCIPSGLVCYLFSTKNEKVGLPFHPRSALQRLNFQATRNTALKIETW